MDSQLTLTTPTATEQAWHILALLVSLNRPAAHPVDLASCCTLFPCTPRVVELLCSIPNSPLSLTGDSIVTASVIGLIAIGRVFVGSDFGDGRSMRKRKRDGVEGLVKRRAGFGFRNVNVAEDVFSSLCKGTQSTEVCLPIDGIISKSLGKQPNYDFSFRRTMHMPKLPCLTDCNSGPSSSKAMSNEIVQAEIDKHVFMQRLSETHLLTYENFHDRYVAARVLDDGAVCGGEKVDETCLGTNTSSRVLCHSDVNKCSTSLNGKNVIITCEKSSDEITGNIQGYENKEEKGIDMFDSTSPKREKRELIQLIDAVSLVSTRNIKEKANDLMPSLSELQLSTAVKGQVICQAADVTAAVDEMSTNPVTKMVRTTHEDVVGPEVKTICTTSQPTKSFNGPKVKRVLNKSCKSAIMPQKPNGNNDALAKRRSDDFDSLCPKDDRDSKALPHFESFVVDGVEGSGGYGTVYRARRKSDGIIVAIKCPHANAHRHHMHNEMKMLELFGGHNFIIKYEGSFKDGNSDCFILEHVEHDRPEVLKKEIDIRQLRWYGYCMFRALSSLHRQGVVHRDVKPGNFLFSRKANKGYLIDFNLALDIHQKYGITNNSKGRRDTSFDQVKLPNVITDVPTTSRKLPRRSALDCNNVPATKDLKSSLASKNQKGKGIKQKMAQNDLGGKRLKSQGADGSGVTSAKDVKSNRTSAVKRKDPVLSHGRKELMNLWQEAMQNQRNETLRVPVPSRKRVAAPPEKVDKNHVYITPMPLGVAGAGIGKNKGDGQRKREGHCVGTKGFRAPEVLFRSQHQGPKLDVWSAGVTLLYLIIGRSPFFGDPDQNIKEIAKLKGSEDLWEVAKIHNCESSFPKDLYNTQYLPSTKLRDWCEMNAKRPEFLNIVPNTLFDLVEKCLVTNPRQRISAEEALKHEFFAPCHEGLRKQRLSRQGLGYNSGTNPPLIGENVNSVKISPAQS